MHLLHGLVSIKTVEIEPQSVLESLRTYMVLVSSRLKLFQKPLGIGLDKVVLDMGQKSCNFIKAQNFIKCVPFRNQRFTVQTFQ